MQFISFRQDKSIFRTGEEEGEGACCAFGAVSGRANKGCVASGISRSGVQGEAKKVGEVVGVPVNISSSWVY